MKSHVFQMQGLQGRKGLPYGLVITVEYGIQTGIEKTALESFRK